MRFNQIALSIIVTLLIQSSAQAFMTLKAKENSACGPYRYQNPISHQQDQIPLLASNFYSQGYYIGNEETKLNKFLNNWANFFLNNGESQFKLKMLCYGFYDDTNSTGPNAFAYGDEAILVGTGMMASVRDHVNEYINQNAQAWSASQQQSLIQFSAYAAQEFVLFHEFAHFLQNLHQYSFTGPTQKNQELNADCVGGMMQSMSRIANNQFSVVDTVSAMMYAYALGDGDVNNFGHHGFPDERQAAYAFGLQSAINLKNKGVDLSKLKSVQIIEICRQSGGYR